MHYENGIIHADTDDLAGLIRTAQEILPEFDGVEIPLDAELVLDQTARSPVRVAAFRLTNCLGAYNSGRTFDNLEPRWAWKDAMGVWHRETPSGAMVAGATRDEVVVRRWIANAPVRSTENTSTDLPVEQATSPARLLGRFVGNPRSPRSYTNVPESVQGTLTFSCEQFLRNGRSNHEMLDRVRAVLPNDDRDYRLVARRGRRWHWFRLRGGSAPLVSTGGHSGRAAAIRWVDAG